MTSNTDRIEKTVLLKAPLARAWQAVTDAHAFGLWFGAEFDGPFVAGEKTTGRVFGTRIDESIAEMQKPFFGMACDFITESGYDSIPLARRAKAFANNDQGWAIQSELLDRYLSQNA